MTFMVFLWAFYVFCVFCICIKTLCFSLKVSDQALKPCLGPGLPWFTTPVMTSILRSNYFDIELPHSPHSGPS